MQSFSLHTFDSSENFSVSLVFHNFGIVSISFVNFLMYDLFFCLVLFILFLPFALLFLLLLLFSCLRWVEIARRVYHTQFQFSLLFAYFVFYSPRLYDYYFVFVVFFSYFYYTFFFFFLCLALLICRSANVSLFPRCSYVWHI